MPEGGGGRCHFSGTTPSRRGHPLSHSKSKGSSPSDGAAALVMCILRLNGKLHAATASFKVAARRFGAQAVRRRRRRFFARANLNSHCFTLPPNCMLLHYNRDGRFDKPMCLRASTACKANKARRAINAKKKKPAKSVVGQPPIPPPEAHSTQKN